MVKFYCFSIFPLYTIFLFDLELFWQCGIFLFDLELFWQCGIFRFSFYTFFLIFWTTGISELTINFSLKFREKYNVKEDWYLKPICIQTNKDLTL